MNNGFEITSLKNPALTVTAIPGHFVTSHSHINYYIDITRIKHRHAMAQMAAMELSKAYEQGPEINTIICMDDSEVIGSFLALELSQSNMMSPNHQQNIHIVTPEFNSNNQMIFRDNIQPMITGKNVLLLIASITTGKTLKRSLECLNYYNGRVVGVATLFSAIPESQGFPINSIFTTDDLPGYVSHSMRDCPQCQQGIKIDALANSFGYSEL